MNKRLFVVKTVCEKIMEEKLSNRTRKTKWIRLRTIYYKIARDLTGASLQEIGKSVGRDHATVCHGLKLFWVDIESNAFYKSLYLRCKRTAKVQLENKYQESELSNHNYLHENINLKFMVADLEERLNRIPLNIRMKYQ